MNELSLDDLARWQEEWRYDDWFIPVVGDTEDVVIAEAEEYVQRCGIENHPFFELAASSRYALQEWVSQELIITGPISQLMLQVGAQLNNVHLRSQLVTVVSGEHCVVRQGTAKRAHPWLLHRLRESMGISPQHVRPRQETLRFLAVLAEECLGGLTGIAAIAIGNERLVVPEYSAVKRSFASAWPSSEYEAFLDANIYEDERHARLLAEVAALMISKGGSPDAFLAAAKRSVDARIEYYDSLSASVAEALRAGDVVG